MLQAVVAVCLLVAVSAQVPGFGKCPDIKLKPELNVTRYLGDWYEIQHFFAIFQVNQECTKATYTLKDDGHINVFNRGISKRTGLVSNATGDAYVPDKKFPSKLGVRFSEYQPYGKYWVVDTDYETYSLVYSCSQFLGAVKTEYAWILARTPTLDDKIVQSLRKRMADEGVDPNNFKVTNQKGCPDI